MKAELPEPFGRSPWDDEGMHKGDPNQMVRSLRHFILYRIFLSGALTLLFFTHTGPGFLGRSAPGLFAASASLYLILTLLSALLWFSGWQNKEQQAHLIIFTDIIALILMMHASGGIASGLGILIAVSITGGAMIMSGRAALLFAALATLLLIAEQFYSDFPSLTPDYLPQAGFLGAVFFAIALLTLYLSGRLHASQKLVHTRTQELGKLARLNEYIIQHMRSGVLAVDANGRIILMNEPAWHLLGMPMASTGGALSHASPELDQLLREWREDHSREFEPFSPQPQGREIKPQIRPLGLGSGDVLLFLEDSSQVQQEAQQMKLASLGRLTASIAHEIRNPLGAISHASQLLNESTEIDAQDRRLIDIIKGNSDRVNQVIENVIQLSRRRQSVKVSIRLKAWFETFTADLRLSHGFDAAEVYCQIEPDCEIQADREQLWQIVSNLCQNALVHAPDPARLRLGIIGGIVAEFNHPIVDIIDNGPGIKPSVVKHIFEPFFTTRADGTGLGLYITKELCESNQIRLEYIPGPTGGSCFRLHFG